MIHVCPLSRVQATVEEIGARHLISLLKDKVQRPACIRMDDHLVLEFDDITTPLDGYVVPCEEHVSKLIRFVSGWDRRTPMVIHCWAGISRSTAAAYVAACALNPRRDERSIARELRRASPTATPNLRLVALADGMLERNGRMVEAIETIGRGTEAYEGHPFRLELD